MSKSGSLPMAGSVEGVISALLYMLSSYAHRRNTDTAPDPQLARAIHNHLRILHSCTSIRELPMLAATLEKLLKYHWMEPAEADASSSQPKPLLLH